MTLMLIQLYTIRNIYGSIYIWTWFMGVYNNEKPVTITFVKIKVYCNCTFCFATRGPSHPFHLRNLIYIYKWIQHEVGLCKTCSCASVLQHHIGKMKWWYSSMQSSAQHQKDVSGQLQLLWNCGKSSRYLWALDCT
jgi:hypothetical protein